MAETNLALAVEAANDASRYDTNVKCLLADKQVLARILKYAVSEFRDMSVHEITGCIGDDIEIGTRPLDAGLTNLGRVNVSNTEDNIPGEGKIFFDVRFSAFLHAAEMKMLLNVEAQKSSDPKKLGYHLENRIAFYLSRMISSQKQTEFYHSDYDSLKKIRSIWICMDNREDEDSIEEIGMERKRIYGKNNRPVELELMKGIIINIRKEETGKESQNELIAMLEVLLSQMDTEKKKQELTRKYGMVMTEEIEGRLETMCNLSRNIEDRALEKGIEQGIEQGIEKGIAQGIEKERLNTIGRMIKAGETKEKILSYGYTEEEVLRFEKESLITLNS